MGQQNNRDPLCYVPARPLYKNANDLVFYTTVQDQQFGQIQVYCSSRKPSCYVAKVQKKIENSKIYNIFQHIQNSQTSWLASLHAFQITRQKYFTGYINQKISAYWEYYNYSFADYLKMRSIKHLPFKQNEIWMIIKACCQSYSIFNSYDLVLDLDLKHIVVIPEGKIKIYWHSIQLNNKHLKFYQQINQKFTSKISLKKLPENGQFRYDPQKDMDNFYFSPEQIQGIQKKQKTLNIDFAKANSFRLGMILLYCITLTNPIKTCYGRNSSSNLQRIKVMVLNSLYENKIQSSSKYSEDLKHLIKLLLLQDHNKRIPITFLQKAYSKYMIEQAELITGFNQNPLYAPSSSRKNLEDFQNQEKEEQKKRYSSNHLNRVLAANISQKDSLKIIEESRVRSSINQQNQGINDSNRSKQYQQFDKFDTKTIKISSNYNKKER